MVGLAFTVNVALGQIALHFNSKLLYFIFESCNAILMLGVISYIVLLVATMLNIVKIEE